MPANAIQRYDLDADWAGACMRKAEGGDYVLHDDHEADKAAAVRELLILRAVFGLNESDKVISLTKDNRGIVVDDKGGQRRSYWLVMPREQELAADNAKLRKRNAELEQFLADSVRSDRKRPVSDVLSDRVTEAKPETKGE